MAPVPTPAPTPSQPTTDAAAPTEPAKEVIYNIQDPIRFSQSHVWRLMSAYYANTGVDAWTTYKVPYFITCNAYIARTYALMIQEFVRDLAERVYIVELGAGSGKLGFHMLRALSELPDLDLERVTYVMTDFADKNIEFWRQHPGLAPHVESGLLDFAKFDMYRDSSVLLINGDRAIEKNANVVLIANYVVDSMAADAFRVADGKLQESRVAIRSKTNENDAMDHTMLTRMINEWAFEPVSGAYYADKKEPCADILDDILKWYHTQFADSILEAHVILPIAFIRMLERAFADTRRLWTIVGDKGFTDMQAFTLTGAPHMALHESFSIMANLHALGLYFQATGGVFLHNPQAEAGIKVSCFMRDSRTEPAALADAVDSENAKRLAAQPKALVAAYGQHVVDFGPTDFYASQRAIALNKEISAEGALTLVKLSNYDPDTFFNIKEVIIEQLTVISKNLRQDVYRALGRIADNYYRLNRDRDLMFEYGRLFFKTREFAKALTFYEQSTKTMGEHNVTMFNIALCYKEMGDKDKAMEYLKRSVKLDPAYDRAKALLIQMHAEIQVNDVAKIKLA
jgi:tetratricopeptide (TPR) repeat protein